MSSKDLKMFRVIVLLSFLVIRASSLNNHSFPNNFMFGVATASYQIEGGWDADGKGENMWDWWTHTFPEKISNRYSGDVTCDSYHLWRDDVEMLKHLGVNHYRLSISWSRVLPEGTTNYVNQKGVEYYRNLFQALLDNGITPLVTIYHWDLPQPFNELGGWMNPLIVDYLGDYARVCFQLFGDLVKNWITINEPQTTCLQGYTQGYKAPGYANEGEGIYLCAYTHVLAHARAYHIYDEEFRALQNGTISIVLDSSWSEPASDSDKDLEAAETQMEFILGLYANPIYNGNWPRVVIDRVGTRSLLEGYSKSRLPEFTQEQIDYVKGTYDFFALNTYATNLIYHQIDVNQSIGKASYFLDSGTGSKTDPSWKTVVGWVNDVPWGFRKLLNWVSEHYKRPDIFITENGWSDYTGELNDQDRIEYIGNYLSAILDAIYEDGINILGYTVWTLMDNFEWQVGYSQKMGLYYVDFDSPNRTRTPKASAEWFAGVIRGRCLLDQCEN
ncbi:myrosinase 1-like [Cylas formicarius]|uniref:myrosinase 1-like n=1 Tax=Cylas formicarius TaxID=197179 RepID=UPI002958DBCC|nr:myrosinase 1-like [Cylas formicarius]